MSRITDFLNRIFRRNSQKRLDAPERTPDRPMESVPTTPKAFDDILVSQMDLNALNRFQDPRAYNEYCQNFFAQGNNFGMQYDYVSLLEQMEQSGAMQDYLVYQDYILGNQSLFYPSPVHGIDHTSRVTFFAEMLTMLDNVPPHEKYLIMNAAILHDIGRGDDKKDFDHGPVGAKKIRDLGILDNFSPRDRDIICFAVASHGVGRDHIDEELQKIPPQDRADYKLVWEYLTDADKLDRVRIANRGWGLDPSRLSTPTATRLVKVAHQNFYQFGRVMNYERNRDQIRAHRDFINNCFNQIRQNGFNIPFSDFEAIINEYNPGTLEMLAAQGKVEDIFKYSTFMQYGKKQSFEESIRYDENRPDLSFDGIFEDTKRNMTTALMRSTLNDEFMLFYNLKKNKPDSYEILMTSDVDISYRTLTGIASVINMGDIMAMRDAGYPFRISDFMHLASRCTPERVREILNTRNYQELVSDTHATSYEIKETQDLLKQYNLNYDPGYVQANFRYIQFVLENYPEVLHRPEISQYTFSEIFAACNSIKSATDKLFERKTSNTRGAEVEEVYTLDVPDDIENIMRYLKFFKQVNAKQFLEDEKRLEVIFEVGRETEALSQPSFVEYMCKTHRPYEASNLREKVFYKQFCVDQILNDPNLSLDEAKEKLMLGLFDFNVPSKYLKEFEQEFLKELHYHKKYLGESNYERENSGILSQLRAIFDSNDIEEFRKLLASGQYRYDSFNLERLQADMRQHLMDISKTDMVQQLQQTERQIDSTPTREVIATNGQRVNVKVLSGQKFTLATCTLLPKCSAHSRRKETKEIMSSEELQRDILNRDANYRVRCTSLSNQDMLARSSAARPDCDLVFAYVPRSTDQISISANYDLSSTRAYDRQNKQIRVTNRPTSYMRTDDQINETIEEHNETVMDAYPRYIICYDEVTPLALQKQQQLNAQYKRDGIKPPVELVLVQAKDVYIPRIKQNIVNEHQAFLQKFRSGQMTLAEFDRAFLDQESNIITRTIQAVNSTTITEDNFRTDNFHADILESLTQIIEEIASSVPPDRAKAFSESVQVLVDRGDSTTEYGARYYNEYYLGDIPTGRLRRVQRSLVPRYADRENLGVRNDGRNTDTLEPTDPVNQELDEDTAELTQ